MVKPIRQITFRIPKELWEEFTIKAVRDGKNKTKLLIEFIEKYLEKKK
ncbi:hypothetical protein GOV12_05595 [Candidatus Pacearchaeota archaeon]|nr:hypothetical protein [Candidatus Pacearchaeota archaeon]